MSQEDKLTQAARGSFILIVAFFIVNLLNYVFNVGMAWFLSVEWYGVFGVSMAMFMILGTFVQHGFPPTVAKFLAEVEADKPKILRSSFLGNFLLGIVVVGIFYLIMGKINLGTEYKYIIPVLAIAVILFSIGWVSRYALQGLFRFKEWAFTDILSTAVRVIFGFSLVLLGFGVVGAISGVAIGAFVLLLVSLFLIRETKFWKKGSGVSLGIYKFVAPMFLGTLGLTFMMNIDLLGVRFLAASDEMVGYYQSAITLARLPVWMAWGIMGATFPFISRYSGLGEANRYISASLKYSFLFLIPISIAFIVLPGPLLTLFFPAKYLPAANALAIVSIGMTFLVIINVLARSLQALSHPVSPAIFLTTAIAIQILLLWYLVPRYEVVGAASATTIACFIGLIPLIWQCYRRGIGLNFNIKILPCYGVLAALLYFLPHNGRSQTVLVVIVGGVIYLAALRLMKVMTRGDMEIILSGVFTRGNWVTRTIMKVAGFGNSADKEE